MKKLGLLGKNIAHSKSKKMYEEILDTEVDYTLFDFEFPNDIPTLEELFEKVDGLSITSPYKKHFLENVRMDDKVKNLKAINCIKKFEDRFFATNTDYLAVKELIQTFEFESIVLLGNGAMANITSTVLSELNLNYLHFFRSKSGDISELDLTQYNKCLVVNSCSRSFLFKGQLSKNSTFWDYNYSNQDQKNACTNSGYVDGLSLLRLQAVHALSFWNKTNT